MSESKGTTNHRLHSKRVAAPDAKLTRPEAEAMHSKTAIKLSTGRKFLYAS